jgi:error-prone DNA polymerase
METYRERFMAGARRNGVAESVAVEIYRQIESFAGYAFCKAHSASFALESFESAYWKAHYPAEFMAAVLTNQGGYYTPMEYAEEARRLEIRLLPPCVNTSRKEFWGRRREIRVGLMQVKGLADESVESILAARSSGGPFQGLGDVLSRARLSQAEAVSLARCGGFDAFPGTRPRHLWEIELRMGAGGAAATDATRLAVARGGGLEALIAKLPELPPYDARQRMHAELEVLEMTLETHPFALFESTLARVRRLRPVVTSVELRDHVDKDVYLLGWKVTAKRTTTVDDEPMCFVTFSDERGRFEASFFPEVYARYALELVRGMGPFLIKGRVEVAFGAAEVVASHVKLLSVHGGGGTDRDTGPG